MEWQQFIMHLEALPPGDVELVFEQHGALAVTYRDAHDDARSDISDSAVLEPAPGEWPLWNEASITGLFPATTDLEDLRNDLLQALRLDRLPQHRVELLEDRLWEREWLKDFRPMRFGRRLWVCPSGHTVDARDAIVVRLDPGLAFGSGTHPTTAMCLEWLDGRELRGKKLLDVGCGSGVLSIAAALMGATAVTAVDIDPQAVTATLENARRNGAGRIISTAMELEQLDAPFDIIIANILAGPLVLLAGTISERLVPGGALALSGILEHQVKNVADAYRQWIAFGPPTIRSPWARLDGSRIGTGI